MNTQPNILAEISNDIVAQLEELEISQSEIVKITGKSKGNISKIFNGKHYFSMEDIKAVSCELNIPVISYFYNHIYGQLASDDKTLLKTLSNAEKKLAKNLKELKELKNKTNKKAAS